MKTIELSNDFHCTEAGVRPILVREGPYKGTHRIAARTIRRLRQELCGADGCTCGGNLGERGGVRLSVIGESYGTLYVMLPPDHA